MGAECQGTEPALTSARIFPAPPCAYQSLASLRGPGNMKRGAGKPKALKLQRGGLKGMGAEGLPGSYAAIL